MSHSDDYAIRRFNDLKKAIRQQERKRIGAILGSFLDARDEQDTASLLREAVGRLAFGKRPKPFED